MVGPDGNSSSPYALFQVDHHNHLADKKFIERCQLLSRMEQSIRQDPSKPIRRVYTEVVRQDTVNSEEESDGIPEFSEVRSSLARQKRQLFPPIPRRVQDVIVDGSWTQTWERRQFLVHQDNQWGLLIFMTARNAGQLRRCDTVYIDGTFKTCPKPFSQVVSIHGMYGDRVLPLAFCILKSKEVALYREMLSQIKAHVRRLTGRQFNPTNVICDFEMSLLTAVETELPRASLHGCYFHFCKSLWRKIQDLGLSGAYKRQPSVKKFLRKVMCLGYIPLALVRVNFNLMNQSNTVRRLIRNVPGIRQFITYFRRNYMDGNFPPRLWNVFERNVDFRTNNHVEGRYAYATFRQRWAVAR